MYNPWFKLMFEAARMGCEAQQVIAMRMVRMATGSRKVKETETRRMISEKLGAISHAGLLAASAALTGKSAPRLAGQVLDVYKKKVHANRRRLSR